MQLHACSASVSDYRYTRLILKWHGFESWPVNRKRLYQEEAKDLVPGPAFKPVLLLLKWQWFETRPVNRKRLANQYEPSI